MIPSDLPSSTNDKVYCMAACPPKDITRLGGENPPTAIIYVPQTPIIVEDRYIKDGRVEAIPEIQELIDSGVPWLSKKDARIPNDLFRIIVADTVLITHRTGANEPSILFVQRDAKAPGGARLCCPGGWSGWEGPTNTSTKELNEEIAIDLGDGSRLSMEQAISMFKAFEVDDVLQELVICHIPPGQSPSIERMNCRPFYHADYQPGIGDDNVLNLLNVVAMKLPSDAKIIDITGFGRTTHEVPLSQIPQWLEGKPTLPGVLFVRDKLLAELRTSPALQRLMVFQSPPTPQGQGFAP